MPVDPATQSFDKPNPAYENTVLFYVANFQYLVTCIAFSIAKPFRKQIWTNYPYLFSIMAILLVDTLLVFLPYDSWLPKVFNVLPFIDHQTGETYYGYKAWLGLGIVINSILTYAAETAIILTLTRRADKMGKKTKQEAFDAMMDHQQI